MKDKIIVALLTGLLSNTASAGGMEDDPIISKVMINQFETRITDGKDPLILEADAWIGKDLNKFWFKTDVERVNGETEELELQALYSRAIAPFWDLQVGWRHDAKPKNNKRDWLALGINGLAPYWFEVDSALFIGEEGRVGLRLQAEYEIMFTQRWILSPEAEVNFHSKDDEATGTGSGLSDTQLGLRLRYEISREFAPYVGLNWNKKFGKTEDYAKAEGEKTDDLQFVVGLRAWF